MKKEKVVLCNLGLLLLTIIILLIYFNAHPIENIEKQKDPIEKQIEYNNQVNTYTSSDIILAIRIDDITFGKNQKETLKNALYLAKKYNIKFDLAVIAAALENNSSMHAPSYARENMDPEVFKIYQDNQDVFEIVAHGYNHVNPLNESSTCEFYERAKNITISPQMQEEEITKMIDIFIINNMTLATKYFITPCNEGDINTILIAKKKGYNFISQENTPNMQDYIYEKNFTIARVRFGIESNKNFNVTKYLEIFKDQIKKKRLKQQIFTHPVNFLEVKSMEELIVSLKNIEINNQKIKFEFLSKEYPA